jgi:type IV secretion system protein TrbB
MTFPTSSRNGDDMTVMPTNLSMTEEDRRRRLAMIDYLLGDTIRTALADNDVTEVYANHDGRLRTNGIGGCRTLSHSLSLDTLNNVLSVIADFAGRPLGGEVTSIAATLPTGERFHGMIPPSTRGPAFAIRRPPRRIFPLDEYVERGIMTQAQVGAIRQAIADRRNIATIGATSSGKTTLLNAILSEPGYAEERLHIIQDVPELRTVADDVEFLFTDPKTILELLMDSMRLNPDRIVVGEVRGIEAWDMLQTWNTGHEGSATTFHANNPASGLRRLQNLCAAGGKMIHPGELIETMHCIVHIARDPVKGRVVKEVAKPVNYDRDTGLYECAAPA